MARIQEILGIGQIMAKTQYYQGIDTNMGKTQYYGQFTGLYWIILVIWVLSGKLPYMAGNYTY